MLFNVGGKLLKIYSELLSLKKNEAMSFHKKYCDLSCVIGKERGDDTKKS